MEKINKNSTNGITLIALVITIIVLLILAGVSIAMLTGDNGILTQGNNAKIETAVGTVKEQLKLLQGEKIIQGEKVTPEILLAEGKIIRTVQLGENDKYYMYYAIKKESFEGMQGLGKGDLTSLKDVFLIDDDLNVRYIASNGKEYGDQINKKILEDETEIRFSSKAFSEYISKISGVTESKMKFRWMKNQTSLTIADPKVDSLQDLVFFPNLTSLTLGEYGSNIPQITSMDGVENCTKLTNLTILYGPDKNYSAVAQLYNLNTFYKDTGTDYINIISELKSCKNLEKLTLRNLNIKDMEEIGELSDKLNYLDLYYNKIDKLKGLEDKISLTSLNLGYNNLKDLEGLENLKNLKNLILNNNQITNITPLSANISLTTLDLKGNTGIDGNRLNYRGENLKALDKIGEILDRGGSINLDIDKLGLFTNYKILDLSNQNLETLEGLEGLTELKHLNLTSNKLTLEDEKSQEILKSMTYLENLYLVNNNITNIEAINNLKNLKNLYIAGNNINLQEIQDIISNLTTLTVSTEVLKTITNCDINKITTLNLITSNLTEIPDLSKFSKLTKLSLYNNPNISNFNMISKIASLESLDLNNNNLHGRTINLSKLTNLTNLNLSENTLWSEDLENLKALKNNTGLTINLSNNSIIDATALLELNPTTKIDLRNNINLSQDSKDKLKARFGSNVTF